MRDIAAYALQFNSQGPAIRSAFNRVQSQVREWIAGKGAGETTLVSGGQFSMSDGRPATLIMSSARASGALSMYWELSEKSNGNQFRTRLNLAKGNSAVVVFCTLEAGLNETVVAPLSRIEARCPRVIRKIIDMEVEWCVGSSRVTSRPVRFSGQTGGGCLVALLRDPDRSIPVIVVSEDSGFPLHPGIDDMLAWETAGLAQVASLDGSASWELTRQLGVEWSCFNGAIRIYWPGFSSRTDPFGHWLWTAGKLTDGVPSTADAARRIAQQLRWKLMGVSTLSMMRPALIGEIREAAIREEVQRLSQLANDSHEFAQLAESYDKERREAQAENQRLRDLLARAQTDLENERLCRGLDNSHPQDLVPETETPPSTLKEAKQMAARKFAKQLVFGASVDQGIATLDPIAGPPDKILSYLKRLSEAADARRAGTLGTSPLQWLRERGVVGSGEGEVVRNSAREMQKRTWDWGIANKTHEFELHLKPSEGTSPDRCVRIYFDWCERRKKFVVGWIGRHP